MLRNTIPTPGLRAGLLLTLATSACLANRTGYERASATADKTEAYRENVVRLRDQVDLTLGSLRTLTENPSDSPRSNRETFQTFERELANLQALVQRSRSTYGSMDAQAQLFFGRWIEESAQIQNGDLKKSSAARRAALQANYDKLAQGQLGVDQAVDHFVDDLTDLRFYLEHDLTAAGLSSAQGPIATTFADGAKLQDQLSELAHVTADAQAALTPLQDQAPSRVARETPDAHVR